MKTYRSIYNPIIKVPQTINIELLSQNFLATKVLNVPKLRVMDSIALFLYHIYIKHNKKVQRGKISKQGFVPYHVTYRRKLLGKNENLYVDFIIKAGLLKTRQYKVNQRSTGFRLALTGKNKTWIEYKVTDKSVLKRLIALEEESNQLMDQLMLKIAATKETLNLPTISVHPEVFEIIHKMKNDEINLAESDIDRSEIEVKYDVQLENIRMINAGNYSEQRDRTGNRFHTRMVRMMKELRPYLLINNQATVEIDIKNSQPFFMQLVAKPHMWTPQPVKEKLHISNLEQGMILKLTEPSSFQTEVMNVVDGNTKLTTKKLGVRKVKVTVEGEEVEADPSTRRGSILLLAVCVSSKDEPTGLNFLRLAADGTLYDVLTNNYNSCFFDLKGNDLLADKAIAKKTIISELYNNYHTLQYKGYKTVLENLFPNFFLFTKLLKETGYKNLSILLQRVEATVFLEGAVETFLTSHPDTSLVTVHDSVLSPKSMTPAVKTFIEDFIEDQVGSRPTCTVKESPLTQEVFVGVSADDITPSFMN